MIPMKCLRKTPFQHSIFPSPQIHERIEVKPVTTYPHDFQTFLRPFSGHWLGSPLKIWELSSGSASMYYFQHLEKEHLLSFVYSYFANISEYLL